MSSRGSATDHRCEQLGESALLRARKAARVPPARSAGESRYETRARSFTSIAARPSLLHFIAHPPPSPSIPPLAYRAGQTR